LTTIHDKHVEISGDTIHFEFRGKSGIRHRVDLNDRRLARIVQRCQEVPGYELFQYLDPDGSRHTIDSADVNAYLREVGGENFTAKDFRTWAGTVLAARALKEFEAFDSRTQAKQNIVRAIQTVAKQLGNTRSVCRKCYVHPAVLDAYLDGSLVQMLARRAEQKLAGSLSELDPEEAAVLAFFAAGLETRDRGAAGERATLMRKVVRSPRERTVLACSVARYLAKPYQYLDHTRSRLCPNSRGQSAADIRKFHVAIS
jgi:DNA topoisomerase-1